jgi:hypothetical protein
MFTVKLCKGRVTKLVEAAEVNIYPCGPTAGSDLDPSRRTNEIFEIAGETSEGKSFAFYVRDLQKAAPDDNFGFAPEVDFYGCAFIENSHGATTETVRPY